MILCIWNFGDGTQHFYEYVSEDKRMHIWNMWKVNEMRISNTQDLL